MEEYYATREQSKNRVRKWEIHTVDRVRPPGRISPSSINGCKRYSVLSFTGVKPPRYIITADNYRIFDYGNWAHERNQYTMFDMEQVLGKDRFEVIGVEIYAYNNDLFIAGHLDARVRVYYEDGSFEDFIIDWKTMNKRSWEWFVTQGKANEKHSQQLVTYMNCDNVQVEKGVLVGENKDTLQQAGYIVTNESGNWPEVEAWTKNVIKHLDARRLPRRHQDCTDEDSTMARNCKFSGLCYGGNTTREIERLAFCNFPGTKELWDKGNEIAAAQDHR